MPKVSVIIPVYGVEKYIERCARSLFEQTLDDIELIFVDDSTKDNSMDVLCKVLNDYPNRKGQVKIYHHEENLGLPRARKTGLKYATGEYIAHCDSDDWVDHGLYEAMYEKAKEKELDMVVCNFRKTDGFKERIYVSTRTTDKWEYLDMMLNVKTPWTLWSRIVHRSVFNNTIMYPGYNMGEDMAISIQLLYFCNKIGIINTPYYNYFANTSSITRTQDNTKVINNAMGGMENVILLENFFKNQLTTKSIENGIIHLKLFARSRLLPYIRNKKYYNVWKNIFPEINKKILFLPNISCKEKIKFVLALCRLYPLL